MPRRLKAPEGLTEAPGWLHDSWMPTLAVLEAPLLDEFRSRHCVLLDALAGAQAEAERVFTAVAPATAFERQVWELAGNASWHPQLGTARRAQRDATLVLVDFVEEVGEACKQGGALFGELTGLARVVPTNDERRRPDVARLGRFVRDTLQVKPARQVEKVRRAYNVSLITEPGERVW